MGQKKLFSYFGLKWREKKFESDLNPFHEYQNNFTWTFEYPMSKGFDIRFHFHIRISTFIYIVFGAECLPLTMF